MRLALGARKEVAVLTKLCLALQAQTQRYQVCFAERINRNQSIILGAASHIDHGKTALVKVISISSNGSLSTSKRPSSRLMRVC
ncbi:MAG: hypothetical protein WA672_08245 [Candidatus Angelobacter sp.]